MIYIDNKETPVELKEKLDKAFMEFFIYGEVSFKVAPIIDVEEYKI